MKDWGIIVDSSCGESKEWIEKNGGFFLPFKIFYDNKEFDDDGVSITNDQISKKISDGIMGKTSVPSTEDIKDIYTKALKKYKRVIVLPISEKVSGMYNAFRLISEDKEYKGSVNVLKSNLFSPWISNIVNVLLKDDNNKISYDSAMEWISDINDKAAGVMSFVDLKFLAGSGRISATQARIGFLAGIKPTLLWFDGEVSKEESIKARNTKKGITKGAEMLYEYMTKRNMDPKKYYVGLSYCSKENDRKTIISYIESAIPGYEITDESSSKLMGVAQVHIGNNITAFGIFSRMKGNE